MQQIQAREFQRQAKVQRLARSPAIARFLEEEALGSQAATHYAAGYAQRGKNGWTLSGGAAGDATLETPFDLASVSKSVFATVVSHLVGAGELSWTSTLREVLPETKGTWAGERSVEALLSHRSGLRAHVEMFLPSWSGAPIDSSALRQIAATSSQDTPSGAPLYSDLGYILLGAALERLSGVPLDRLMSDIVCVPWGLQIGSARAFSSADPKFRALVAPTENQAPRGGVLRGEVHDDNCWALAGSGACGHAGLFGTLEGVLRFGVMLLEGTSDRVDETTRTVFEPLIRRRPGGSLRMGFDGVSGPDSLAGKEAGQAAFGHLGFTGTSFWCDPSRDRVTVLLTNRVFPTRRNPRIRPLRPKIHDFLWLC